jgi:enediyne polyketide synthase
MGRSRKPLCAQAYRGFKSLSLRQFAEPLAGHSRGKARGYCLRDYADYFLGISIARQPAEAARTLSHAPFRGAVLASRPSELRERLARARTEISTAVNADAWDAGVRIGRAGAPPRVGFIFPGQAAPSRPDGGLWPQCFSEAAAFVRHLPIPSSHDRIATEIAQPAIIAADLAGFAILHRLRVQADVCVGHSLGELAALCACGALTPQDALALARLRGEIMARDARSGGTMLRVCLHAVDVEPIANDSGAVIACENGPQETVLSGPRSSIKVLDKHFRERGVEVSSIPVSHAFHSPDMAAAAPALQAALSNISWLALHGTLVSTVTGTVLDEHADLAALLVRQLTARVRFHAALIEASLHADIFVEVGPGDGLSRVVRQYGVPVVAIDAFGPSVTPLLATLGELHVRGCNLEVDRLFADRPTRPLTFSPPIFLGSPCGRRSSASPVVQLSTSEPNEERDAVAPSADDPLQTILKVVAAESGLPDGSFGPDDSFLEKLHLNSLMVTRIAETAARALGLRAPSAPTDFANATPRILLDALLELREFDAEAAHDGRVAGVRPWAATYAMRWVPSDLKSALADPVDWLITKLGRSPARSEDFSRKTGRLIWLPGKFTSSIAERLVGLVADAARERVRHLAIVHDNAPVSGFARSLALERSFESVRVLGGLRNAATEQRALDALAWRLGRYTEMRFGRDGTIESPIFEPAQPSCDPQAAIAFSDVVLVVGGGRSIVAECALRLGRMGAALILAGRSPQDTPQVAETLARAPRAGIRCTYVCADAGDKGGLITALAPALERFGAPTVLVHAAAVNEPMRIAAVTSEIARRALMPKMDAFSNALAACGPTLRRVVTFGSLIGRIGLEGEAHYALANAAQSAATEAWARAKRGRTALALEWSVWGGLGMAERLGTIERLTSAGVDPISVDDALEQFDQLVQSGACGTVSVTSRFGPPPDLDLGSMELPPLRFADRPLVHFPRKEIVLETGLSRGRDKYLDDHVVDGRRVFPGVMALEAMAQAAMCVSDLPPSIIIEDVHFDRAISVGGAAETSIRVAALRSDAGVDTALFSQDDAFASSAMRAQFSAQLPQEERSEEPIQASIKGAGFSSLPLYGPLFFGSGRFRRLDRLVIATSRRIDATLSSIDDASCFGSYEPSDLVLWDPWTVDACLHALQAAVPHRRVLPISVARINVVRGAKPARVRAIEQEARAGIYTFDIEVEDAEGRRIQSWERISFRAIDDINVADVLAAEPALIAPYLERVARETFRDETIRVAFVHDVDGDREARRRAALALLALDDEVERRVDGAPIRRNGQSVSFSHCEGATLAIAARTRIGCDLETAKAGAPNRRLTLLEACRKLGRRITFDDRLEFPSGKPMQIGDVALLALDLPHSSGPRFVAFSCLTDSGATT